MPGIDGLLFAIADRLDPGGRDTQRNKVFFDRVGTALTQAEVVLVGAPLVTMPLDDDLDSRCGLEEFRVISQRIP